jgi:pyruvate/2-oxoglutarate dehydrogenase complex dihydrolipoamide acyltransferase (E2) component
MDKFVRRYDQVDINLIVGTGQALSTPLLRNVQSRGLSSISSEISDFEDLLFSEEGSVLDASRLAVGTFSIHNLGDSMPHYI